MTVKTCAHCHTEFAAMGHWQTLCRSCYAESRSHETIQRLCEECGRPFTSRGDWQTLCRPCYAAQKNRDFEALMAERDAAFETASVLRRELDRLRLELARRSKERVIPGDQWRRLVQLCHPDRHGNSETATHATRWLMENRPI